ncbi:hypothetical protein ACFLTD_01745, partial [Elusimicrobiota bacterium]
KNNITAAVFVKFGNTTEVPETVKNPVRIIPADQTAQQAYHTLIHLDIDYAPVGESSGLINGYVRREELEKAARHGFSHHKVTEFISESFSSNSENGSRDTDVIKGVLSNIKPVFSNIRSKLESNLPADVARIIRIASRTAAEMNIAAYCVGGMVRDILKDVKHQDIDFVVEKKADEFAGKLSQHLNGHMNLHEEFQTAVIKLEYREIDIATLRKEYYEFPAALPKIEQGTLHQDLYRRDFTINAMALQISPLENYGTLIDYFSSRDDLESKKLRILYPLSFVEDPTRIFRAIRFEKRFDLTITDDTLKHLKKTVEMDIHSQLTNDRVKEELILILMENRTAEILHRLDELNVLGCIHPELEITSEIYDLIAGYAGLSEELTGTSQYLWKFTKNWKILILLLFSGLTIENGCMVLGEFNFSKQLISNYRIARSYSGRIIKVLSKDISDARVYKILYKLKEEVIFYIICVNHDAGVRKKIIKYLNELQNIKPRTDGNELKKMGYTPGPDFSRILFTLKLAKINGNVSDSLDDESRFINDFFL